MPEAQQGAPRAHWDRRMYLYFNYSDAGSLRWYVKVSRNGRRIGISDPYGTPGFDAADHQSRSSQGLSKQKVLRSFLASRRCLTMTGPYSNG